MTLSVVLESEWLAVLSTIRTYQDFRGSMCKEEEGDIDMQFITSSWGSQWSKIERGSMLPKFKNAWVCFKLR